ncbi:anaphase spindle elongation protein 1 [Podospora fimiseda]|uniref:Anaphase spindle elongation protein 1 n=1 Tax=Podospora fimiseda TaxID=252190 RepID=A0AAN7GRY7_9PEZI|nr:anaphase spindle elongation protein 1 [Podospora fimiseda]
MDTSYLAQQVNTIIGQLHGLFDEIGVSNHDRETREAELFAALSEALHNQVRLVTAEKKEMIDKAQKTITTIRQMEASLDGKSSRRNRQSVDDDLQITYPLTRCLQVLKERHSQIARLHRERFEQVKKLVQALESYSLHLEPSFVKLELPPTSPSQSIPSTFDLSPAYVNKLDAEFTRVYEEYTQRVGTVQALGENIISLWAELGTPQAQTDAAIVKYYRDAPEQLGLHQEDIARLKSKRDRLVDEKKKRERRLQELKGTVGALWEKLEVDEMDRKSFLNSTRGCGIRQINAFEDELARLNELKRQHLHIFVEDARTKLQELWDSLYYSEDEMLEFTPAFSDVYSDALLEAHEREIARLEVLREQRAPTLTLVDRHKALIQEREELAASSQDASRLMMRGQKGEKRDPGKLLREEKMRKRIAKELPKVTAELLKVLEQWEDEYGRPFLVHGERYLDVVELDDPKPNPGPRSKTPAQAAPTAATLQRAKSVGQLKSAQKPTLARTPTVSHTSKTSQTSTRTAPANTKGSPSRVPGNRPPLSPMKNGNNSPERPRTGVDIQSLQGSISRGGSLRQVMRAPPPKMRDLMMPPPELEAPAVITPQPRSAAGSFSSSIVRHVEPEDVYVDKNSRYQNIPSRPISSIRQDSYNQENNDNSRPVSQSSSRPTSSTEYTHSNQEEKSSRPESGEFYYHPGQAPRQISNSSNNSTVSTVVSGSENWETYDDNSEPEADASDDYYAKVRAARFQQQSQNQRQGQQTVRGIPPPLDAQKQRAGHAANGNGGVVVVDQDGSGRERLMSGGSEWTDEDHF